MRGDDPTLISFAGIARKIRFRQHPTLTACWVWQGYFQSPNAPKTGAGRSARQDIFERVRGYRPGGRIVLLCGAEDCVNPHHVKDPTS